MTTPFGVQDSGFVIKTQTDCFDSLVARAKASPALGPNLDYSSASPLGQLLGLFSAEFAEGWEMGQGVYASNDPEAATGVPLDNVSAITGTSRPDPRFSRSLSQTVNLDGGTTLTAAATFVSPAGRPQILFQLDADVTNPGGSPADIACTFTCTETGPVSVVAGQLTAIASAAAGWNSTTNSEDVVVGRDVGLDPELRALRTVELFTRGGSTVGAIRAQVQSVSGVDSVIVLENTTDSPNTDGLPPHSFAVVLDDGAVPAAADDDVAQSIYGTRPAGIPSDGDVEGTATDPTDDSTHAEHFHRDERKNVYLRLTLTIAAHGFPADGIAQVKAALKARGDLYDVGADVIALFLRAACFNVSGVVDVPVFQLDFMASPTNTGNLTITTYQRATFDTSRITVTVA